MNILGFFSAFLKKNRFQGVTHIVLGIGNIGDRYTGTRHNIGFCIVDEFSRSLKKVYRFTACKSGVITGELPGTGKIAVIKPQTFVNRSGEAAAAVLQASNLTTASLLVVVDDLNLPLGRMRVRTDGSDGGHNGLKSIIGAVGDKFPRIRIGIGPVLPGISTIDFVLGAFPQDKLPEVQRMIVTGAKAVDSCLRNGVNAAMNTYNRN
jgi:peptidyl-tRNA hydrolase, PTH1 family